MSMNDTRRQPKHMEKYDILSQNLLSLQLHTHDILSQNSLSLQLHKGSKQFSAFYIHIFVEYFAIFYFLQFPCG